MKIDMHCHTEEGSVDGHVSILQYIEKLKERGFGGMLVTDHGSYGGYEYWRENVKGRLHQDFKVFKGMEYDTFDYGHFIVIMPENVEVPILETRGLTLKKLIKIVHYYGGILGPAHPCGEPFLSFYNTKFRLRGEKDKLLRSFDFIEIYNACESTKSNTSAKRLAVQYHVPGIAGSDAHSVGCVGMGYTRIPEEINSESELIQYLKSKPKTHYGGARYRHTTKDKLGKWNKGLVASFYFYNKTAALVHYPKRLKQLQTVAGRMEEEKDKCEEEI